MESLIVLLGMLVFMFLVLSAAVEAVMEMFRGLLEHFGITWARSKLSLEDALSLSREFAPANSPEWLAKVEALKTAAQQLETSAQERLNQLEQIRETLSKGEANQDVAVGNMGTLVLSIKTDLEQHRRKRIFVTRFATAVIGCLLTWQSEFYVFQILANAPESAIWFAKLTNLQSPFINILVGGLAASVGSSYWHDQLVKIRNLKNALGNTILPK